MKNYLSLLLIMFFATSVMGQVSQPLKDSKKENNNLIFSRDMLAEINKYRAKGCRCNGVYFKPVSALVMSQKLSKLALSHSQDMMRFSFFDHVGNDGSQVYDRAKRAGVRFTSIGENIFMHTADQQNTQAIQAKEVVKSWMNSRTGHCENIMDPDYRKVGVGRLSGVVKKELIELVTIVLSD